MQPLTCMFIWVPFIRSLLTVSGTQVNKTLLAAYARKGFQPTILTLTLLVNLAVQI